MRGKSLQVQPTGTGRIGPETAHERGRATPGGWGNHPGAAFQPPDVVFRRFLESQRAELEALARQSDVLEILPIGLPLPMQYLAVFHCKGLVRRGTGQFEEANQWCVEISLPQDYLRCADVYSVVALRAPSIIFHPNARFPLLCIGDIHPGTPVVDLLYRCYDLITFQKYRLVNHFNEEAAAYVRSNPDRFPMDRRPLKRRRLEINTEASQERT